jgi:glycosyl transferase, family 25
MRIICINLDHSPQRWTFMTGQLRALGVEVERLAAIDGAANVPAWLAPEFAGPHQLTSGEVGCNASHLVAAQMVVGQGLPHVVILEDDVTLDPDFPLACREAVDNAPAGWDCIHLSGVVKRSVVAVQNLLNGRTLVRYSRMPLNAAAYILSNRGARKLLTPAPRRCAYDVEVRHAWLANLNVLGVYPAPARQTNSFQSDIGHYGPSSLGPFSEVYLEWWTARSLGLTVYARARFANIANSLRRRIERSGKRNVAVLRLRKSGVERLASPDTTAKDSRYGTSATM